MQAFVTQNCPVTCGFCEGKYSGALNFEKGLRYYTLLLESESTRNKFKRYEDLKTFLRSGKCGRSFDIAKPKSS